MDKFCSLFTCSKKILYPMKFKAALFYQDALVFYSVYHLGNDYYKAKLDGNLHDMGQPPLLLELKRQGMQWRSDCSENEVVREIGAAIDQRLKRQ